MTRPSMRGLWTILIAASVASAPMTVRADVSPLRTSVEVDTSQVGESGPVIQRRIRERSDVVLRREGVLPARPGKDPIVWVTVLELGGEDPGYAFELQARRGDDDRLHAERFECRLCTETELVSEVETRLAAIVEELATQGESAEATTTADVEETVSAPAEAIGEAAPPRDDARLGPMGKAGIAVLSTGVVGVGVGIGLAIRKDRPQRIATKLTTTKPPGYALIGIGAALAVTGSALLVIDRTRARRRTAFAPWIGPEGAGLTLEGRF